MRGLMMDYNLTLLPIFDRAGRYFPDVEIVSRWPDKSIHRTTYGELHRRVQKLANALVRLGLKPGDRVATLGWNHARHLEAYFAIPLAGGVLHTLNPRLSAQDLAYIMNHAEDRFLLVDDVLLPVYERFHKDVNLRAVVVWTHGHAAPDLALDYEQMIEPEMNTFAFPNIEEGQAAGLCYTSGTTGKPKGVVYSHRALVLHSMVSALPDALGLSSGDAMLPVVPMFHVNAWGLPFTATMVGAKQVFPGPHLDAKSVLDLFQRERVTLTAGVPTVWLGILDELDRNPGAWDTSSVRAMIVGGAAAPKAMIEGFEKRHGLRVIHAWGMTETTPLGTVARLKPHLEKASDEERLRMRSAQGLPVPFVDTRVIGRAAWSRRTASRWESSKYAAPGSRRATSRIPPRPTSSPWTDGSAPATSSPSTGRATSASPIARRTSSSRAASRLARWTWRTPSWGTRR